MKKSMLAVMKKRLFFCVLVGVGGAVMNASAGDIEDKLQMLMPEGVSLGMGKDELQTLRPTVKPPALPMLGTLREARKRQGLAQTENVITNLPTVALYETDLEMPRLIHEYYFVGDKLRAVKGNVSFVRGEKDETAAKQVLDRLSAQMTRLPDVNVIASDGDFQPQTVTFAYWRDERAGISLLAFDSPKGVAPGGMQIILFDEKYFGRKDFLHEPDDMPKLEPLYEQFRKHKTEHDARMQEIRRELKKDVDMDDGKMTVNEKNASHGEFFNGRYVIGGVLAVILLCLIMTGVWGWTRYLRS